MNCIGEFYRGLRTHTQAVKEIYHVTKANEQTPTTRLIAEHHENNYLERNPSDAYNTGVSLAYLLNDKLRSNLIKRSINRRIYTKQQAITPATTQPLGQETLDKLVNQLQIHGTLPKNPLNT